MMVSNNSGKSRGYSRDFCLCFQSVTKNKGNNRGYSRYFPRYFTCIQEQDRNIMDILTKIPA